MLSAFVSAKFKVCKQKQTKQSEYLWKNQIWKRFWLVGDAVLKKIMVPNQFPGFLLYVDKCGRVLAT